LLRQLRVRLLQLLALYAPGATTLRVRLHRLRGVTIGARTFIGTSVLLETSRPELISIGSDCTISLRAVVIAHFRGKAPAERGVPGARFSVQIEDRAFIGPGVIVLEGVTIGEGAVVTAGSVVASSVPPQTMVQGNPAKPIARCRIPLLEETSWGEFLRNLEPIRQ
jgi:acetyltransferase-like isoleucine patch superfamily enzyme